MNNRVWAAVAAFAGLAVLLGIWVSMQTDTTPAEGSAGPRGPKPLSEARAIPLDPPDARLGTGDLAMGQPMSRRGPRGRPDGRPNMQGIHPPPQIDVPPGMQQTYPTTEDGIARAVNDARSELSACYETAKFHSPALTGKMTLQLAVEPAEGAPIGQVKSVQTDSAVDDTMFESCVATVFGEMRFVATEPTTIRYPIDFDAAPPGEVPLPR